MKEVNRKFPKLIAVELGIFSLLVVILFASISRYKQNDQNLEFSEGNLDVVAVEKQFDSKNTTSQTIPTPIPTQEEGSTTIVEQEVEVTVEPAEDQGNVILTNTGTSTISEDADEVELCFDNEYDFEGESTLLEEIDVRDYVDQNYDIEYNYIISTVIIDEHTIWEVNLGEEVLYLSQSGLDLEVVECSK